MTTMQDYSGILNDRQQTARDPYQACLRAVLLQTTGPDYPLGVVPWLESAYPDLYHEITSRLPDRIHDLWCAQAPLSDFNRTTAECLEAHREGCKLFRAYLAQKSAGIDVAAGKDER